MMKNLEKFVYLLEQNMNFFSRFIFLLQSFQFFINSMFDFSLFNLSEIGGSKGTLGSFPRFLSIKQEVLFLLFLSILYILLCFYNESLDSLLFPDSDFCLLEASILFP